jgi:site-specific recombinase XerD
MTERAISPLRRRMIEDMSIRKFAAKTQHDYVQRVKDFATFLGRSPDTAEAEDVRRFRLHLTANGAGTPKINATVAALRFFFKVTLDRPDLTKHLSFIHEPRKAPVVLSPEEVARFLEAAPGIKYKAALSVAYGAGLRVSEVVSLKPSILCLGPFPCNPDSGRLPIMQFHGMTDATARLHRGSSGGAAA